MDTLNVTEHFLKNNFNETWELGKDYFKITGDTSTNDRSKFIKKFNDKSNLKTKVFLLSTKVGGMGINLIGANRVIILEPSWNPCDDLQSIFRMYRFVTNSLNS